MMAKMMAKMLTMVMTKMMAMTENADIRQCWCSASEARTPPNLLWIALVFLMWPPLTYVATLPWIALLALSVSIGLISSSAELSYDAVSGHVESLSWSVIKNLTLHRVRKIFFSFYHHKEQIRSFPTMYNTWGCSLGRNGPKT